ncbi:MAG: glycosyl hydrolase family 28-related protein [bacterium]
MNEEPVLYGANAQDHGARADGTIDDAPAIQQLLDSGISLIYFPAGQYLIGETLRLPSNTRIQAHPFARFRLADGAGKDANSFLLCNANLDNGNENISVQGGIWDRNNENNPRGEESDRNGFTGAMINFRNVQGLTLLDMRLKNSTAYHTRISGTRDFRIERLRFEDTIQARNQDGVHIAGCCEDGLIRDISAVGESCTGDDLIALNADDALDRSETRGKLGGPIRRVRIHGLRAQDCHSFVRMASVWSDIEDIEINDVRGGCRVNVINADALRFCAGPLFRRNDKRYAGGAGLLRGIRLRNVAVYKSAVDDKPFLRLDERMEDFEVENFARLSEADVAPGAPTIQVAFQSTDSILLEGIRSEDVERCEKSSSCTRFAASRMPGPNSANEAFRVEAGIEPAGRFYAWCPQFDRFRVEQSRIEPLPDPDWMVAKGQYTG